MRRQPIVSGQHPAVVFLYQELSTRRRWSECTVAGKAGLGKGALSTWRRGTSPSVGNLEAALNVLGFKLVVAPMEGRSNARP